MSEPQVYLDCRQLGNSGIGSYISNLVRNFHSIAPDHPIQLLVGEENISEAEMISGFRTGSYEAPVYSVREQFRWFMRTRPGRLLHVPHYNAPLTYPGPLAVTVHDVCHKAMSEFFPGMLRKIYAGPFMQAVLSRASRVITVSEFSKAEIVKYYHIAPDKIKVIHNGIDGIYRRMDKEESSRTIEKNGLPQEFMLFVGNVKPHKNILGLISAYRQALLDQPSLSPLVILGDNRNMARSLPELKSFMEDKVLEKNLIFTGYLPKENLPAIYSHSLLFLFPSLYEGFGLPVLEAMACGTPVIASNRASIPEVAGDAALLIDPDDISGMAESIVRMAGDDDLRKEHTAKGLKQIEKFSWRKSAEEHLKIYDSIIGEKRTSRRTKRLPAVGKPKINILFMDQYGDRIGGGQIILLDILEKLRADNSWNIYIYIPEEGKFSRRLKEKNFSYDCVPRSFNFRNSVADMLGHVADSIKTACLLASKVKKRDIDVIYCNGGKTFLSGAILSTLFSVKTFFHLHSMLDEKARTLIDILSRNSGVKRVIAVSDAIKKRYRAKSVHSKIEIIHNWVSPKLFNAPLKERSTRLSFPVAMGIIGQISRAKGQWTVIEALERLDDRILPLRLMIFGDPLRSEKKQWEELRRKISSLNAKGWDIQHIEFQDDVLEIYDRIDLVLIPSLVEEGFGLTAIEAMARSVIVVAARSGALAETVKDKENGFLYDAEDYGRLTDLLREIINNEHDIELIRKTGLETARKHYNPETQLNKIVQMLTDGMNG